MELISGLVLYFACVIVTIAIARSGPNGVIGRLTANDTVAALLASALACLFIIALLMVFLFANQWTHSGAVDGLVIVALLVATVAVLAAGNRSRKVAAT